MRLLDHPNVVSLKHCFFSTTEKDELYLNLVLEYVPETVHRVVKHFNKLNQRMPMIYVKLYAYQVWVSYFFLVTFFVLDMYMYCRESKTMDMIVYFQYSVVSDCLLYYFSLLFFTFKVGWWKQTVIAMQILYLLKTILSENCVWEIIYSFCIADF